MVDDVGRCVGVAVGTGAGVGDAAVGGRRSSPWASADGGREQDEEDHGGGDSAQHAAKVLRGRAGERPSTAGEAQAAGDRAHRDQRARPHQTPWIPQPWCSASSAIGM